MGEKTPSGGIPLRRAYEYIERTHKRTVDPNTPYDWLRAGVGGVKLKGFAIHGKLHTTAADLDAFLKHADAWKANRKGAA